MQYNEAVERFYKKLATHQIMALATSVNDHVTVRNVSCIIYNNKIFFKTDREFRKTKMLLSNPNVALCSGGVQVEGTALNIGLVVDEPGRKFKKLYEQYWATSYNAFPHKDSEILIAVTPSFVEIWDQDENNYGFQIFIDFNTETAELKEYDKPAK